MKKWLFRLCLVIPVLLGLDQLALWFIPDLGAWAKYSPDIAFNTPSLMDCIKLAVVDLPGMTVDHTSFNESYVALKTPLKMGVAVMQSPLDPHMARIQAVGRTHWIIPIDQPSSSKVNSTLTSIAGAITRRCQ